MLFIKILSILFAFLLIESRNISKSNKSPKIEDGQIFEPSLEYGDDESADDSHIASNELSNIPILNELFKSLTQQNKIVGGTPTQVSTTLN